MKYFLFSFFFIFTCISFSQSKYSNEFLKIGVGANYLGQGSSLCTSKDDLASVYYNPSAIVFLTNPTFSAMHNSYFSGISNFDYLAASIPLEDDFTVSASVLRFAIDNIANTFELYNPDGTVNYNNIKYFSVADYSLHLTVAKNLNENIEGASIGANAKFIYRNIGSFAKALGIGFDVGGQIVRENWSIGVFCQDLTTTYNNWSFDLSDSEKEILKATNNEIPQNSSEITMPSVHFGGNYTFIINENINIKPNIKFSVFTDNRNVLIPMNFASMSLAVGSEMNFWNFASFRFGVNNFTKAKNSIAEDYMSFQPNIGLGLKLNKLNINYSLTNIGNIGIGLYSHVVSLQYSLNTKKNF